MDSFTYLVRIPRLCKSVFDVLGSCGYKQANIFKTTVSPALALFTASLGMFVGQCFIVQ